MNISDETLDIITKTDLVLLSDLLRVLLLYKYGGVWIDATVFAHRSLDTWLYHFHDASSIISNLTFFGFRNQFVTSKFQVELPICGWMMVANTLIEENYIMKTIFTKSRNYWYKRVPISYDYFWLHTIINECISEDEKFRDIFYRGVMQTNETILLNFFNVKEEIVAFFLKPDESTIFQGAHLIQLKLHDEIDDDIKEFIDNTKLPISKLTYKYDQSRSINNTVLQYSLGKY